MDTPEITALMLYYGRKAFAEESFESFLKQTYPNKRLIIVNDHPDPVWFDRDYPNVKVYNCRPDTFRNLNEKYNFAFSLIETDWWCPWETDDIWLPCHLTNLVANIPAEQSEFPKKIGVPKSYVAVDNQIVKIGWQMWTGSIYETRCSRGYIYPHCAETIPKNTDGQILFMQWSRYWLWPSKGWPITIIFRWHKEGHASMKHQNPALHQLQLKEKMHSTCIKDPWQPHWDRDYVKDVENFMKGQTHETHNL